MCINWTTVDFLIYFAPKLKSNGFGSGDRRGHWIGPVFPIHLLGNIILRKFETVPALWGGAPSCWYLIVRRRESGVAPTVICCATGFEEERDSLDSPFNRPSISCMLLSFHWKYRPKHWHWKDFQDSTYDTSADSRLHSHSANTYWRVVKNQIHNIVYYMDVMLQQ